MDKLYTFTVYLLLVTCIATTCSARSCRTTSWKTDIDADGYTIHIYGTMAGSGKVKIIHVNVTILAETNIAKLKCKQNQPVSLQPEMNEITCGKCSMKIVHRQTCNMSNDRYLAEYKVMGQLLKSEDQTCDIELIKVIFTSEDGDQLKKTCIGPGEFPCSCPTSETKISCQKNCPEKIRSYIHDRRTATLFCRCVCEAKSKNYGQDRFQMGVLVGGVVGGLFGGVVITVVIVVLCRACRSNRRHTEDEDGAGTKESHTYLGLIHTTSFSGKSPPGTNAVTSQVPDLIKVSDVQQASSAPSDVYDVIKEGDDTQLGVDPSACDQGDYVDITDDMPAVGVYSLAQAAPGMAAQGGTPQPAEYFVLEKDDPTDGDYNKLVRDGTTETGTDVQGTYNRLGREGATETTTDVQDTYNRLVKDDAAETTTDVQDTYNRLVKDGTTETGTDVQGTYNRLGRDGATETGTDVQGTYNRLIRDGATETTTDVQGAYNKLGSTTYDNDNNESGRNIGTAADYFVLETPEDTSNKLAQAAPGIAVQDGTQPSAAEYFVLEKDDPTDGDYNKLVRDGATKTTTDVQDTYIKLGSMVDDNEDSEPGGNNGTAADYFVLEKPEDTYNKLEGKRSTEEEQEPYTKLGEATPKRESESPDDPGGPSREYFILEDQT